MKSLLTIILALSIGHLELVMGFCGFYVSQADVDLFNESSEVIVVRDGNRTVITMSNDFRGDAADFAMVVPVPEVLKEENIRIAKPIIFDKLGAYSAPRLVEYHDNDPCEVYYDKEMMAEDAAGARPMTLSAAKRMRKDEKVTIEASYSVGEYDILILSAKESNGLKNWLLKNGYKIPQKAEEVLEPYIKNKLKFFVVKVNLERQEQRRFSQLNPLQIAFNSSKFMLPIRLGMANAKGDQDMIVYMFTKNGRVELANYRTVDIPTNNNIPLFVKDQFGKFYKDVFKTAHERENGKVAFLEYAWDLSSSNFMKCDPCSGTPPAYADLREAGVYWVNEARLAGADYEGDLYFTRLHVRYNRETFPQDLQFTQTPNKKTFQGRYVLQHPVPYDIDCKQAYAYYKGVSERRSKELNQLATLTGWDMAPYKKYVYEYQQKLKKLKHDKNDNDWIEQDQIDKNQAPIVAPDDQQFPPNSFLLVLAGIACFALVVAIWRWKRLSVN